MKITEKDLLRFWKKIEKKSPDECWLWIAGKGTHGYGRFVCDGKTRTASRVSYEIHFGKVLEKEIVCHMCDNPSCVNPSHLWKGTHKQNAIDRNTKGRGNHYTILPLHKQAEIAHLWYTQDLIQREIAEKYNISRSLVNKIIRMKHFKDRYKQKKFKRFRKITDKQRIEIVNRIKSGEKQINLSKEYNISPRSIRLYLKQLSNL